MNQGHTIEAVDSHTEGEPTRIVTGGIGPIPGATMAEKRAHLRDQCDELRRALVLEPRGHDAVVLAYLTEPVSANALAGVVFANDAGYLGMCGHGTIGVATVLVQLGRIPAREPVTEVVLDTPAGQVAAAVQIENGKPRSVRFRNVPAFVQDTGLTIAVPEIGEVELDISYGGNWFAFVHHDQVGIPVTPNRLDDLMVAAKSIRRALADHGVVGIDPRTGGTHAIDHLKIYRDESSEAGAAARALTLCPGRAFDRSPCGTGTSAKLAILAQRGGWSDDDDVLLSRSILGTEFRARIAGRTRVGGRPAVIPEIEGSAYVTGLQRFVLDPDDPLVHGMTLD